MDILSEVWHRALTTQPAPSGRVIAFTVPSPAFWSGLGRRVGHPAHRDHRARGGARLCCFSVRTGCLAIRLYSDTPGLTVSAGRTTGLGMTSGRCCGGAGPWPARTGSGFAAAHHRAVGLLWALLILLALLLIQVRNWFGLWSILFSAAVVLGVSWWLTPQAQSAFAYVLTWFLLLAAPRPVLELQAHRRGAGDRSSGLPGRLRRDSAFSPAIVWVGFFLVSRWVLTVVGAAGW